jgi:hypothetical protein
MGQASEPGAGVPWPATATKEADSPDDCITVYDTAGRDSGRTSPDGERSEKYGAQVRVRSAMPADGYAKAAAVAAALDRLYWRTVSVDGSAYLLKSFARTGPVLPLGAESPTSDRHLFTINGLMTLEVL